MTRPNERQYVGDLRNMTVHKCGTGAGCQNHDIPAAYTAYFWPDTLDQALDEGFQSCRLCIDRVK